MKLRFQDSASSIPGPLRGFWLSLILVAVAAGGCAHSERAERTYASKTILASEPPPFVTGQCAILLTNAEGFAAQVALQKDPPSDKAETLNGQLLVHGSKIFFAPEYQGGNEKLIRAAGLRYIWDVSENRGYILSEAMQGYAPLLPHGQVTNVVMVSSKDNKPSDRIGGYRCDQEQISMKTSLGTSSMFGVWRAADLNRLPVRITAETSSSKFTLNLSKIRRIVPAPTMFLPPEGFTKYDTAESLTNELIARQQNMRRKTYEPPEGVGEGFQGAHRQQGTQ